MSQNFTSKQEDFTTIVDDTTSAQYVYVGKADIGATTASAVWQIRRMDILTGVEVRWADGVSDFTKIWDDRASITYS